MKIFGVIRGKHGRRRKWRCQVAIERTMKKYILNGNSNFWMVWNNIFEKYKGKDRDNKDFDQFNNYICFKSFNITNFVTNSFYFFLFCQDNRETNYFCSKYWLAFILVQKKNCLHIAHKITKISSYHFYKIHFLTNFLTNPSNHLNHIYLSWRSNKNKTG